MFLSEKSIFDRYRRKPEHRSPNSLFHEHWCTLSSMIFIVIGLLRCVQFDGMDSAQDLYLCYALLGLGSAIHHAFSFRGSLVVDWIPIISFTTLCVYYEMFEFISLATYFHILFALGTLVVDHVCTLLPVPWGHVLWHILAANALDHFLFEGLIEKSISLGNTSLTL